MQSVQEYFDVYNDNKEKTGKTMLRKGSFLNEGEYQLIVIALVERPDHKFLITRRARDKKWAPGAWEVPGGGVRSGETSMEGIIREIREETGVTVKPEEGKLIHWYKNIDLKRGDNYFTDIYHFVSNFDESDICIDRSEAIDHKLATFEEITALAGFDEFLHYKRLCDALAAEKEQ
ncbi:MAG: NUDIX hydrolase [Lachnospiraceae bacterium]|nr:NUDIX hydrolase [Lachnospiraceae bacterium]